MNKIIYSLTIALILTSGVFAQNSKTATKVINDMLNLIENNAIQTKFGFVVVDANSKNKQKLNGTFLMYGNKFVLNTSEMNVYFDGTTQWAYSPSINEVAISNPTEKELADVNPLAILQAYKLKSNIRFAKSTDKTVNMIQLVPKNKTSDFKTILVKVEKSTHFPLYIQLTDKKGNITAISLRQFKKGVKTNKNTFSFDTKIYKDIEINDLR